MTKFTTQIKVGQRVNLPQGWHNGEPVSKLGTVLLVIDGHGHDINLCRVNYDDGSTELTTEAICLAYSVDQSE